ncbi:DNA repair protein rhp57 [Umbelopsis nana]
MSVLENGLQDLVKNDFPEDILYRSDHELASIIKIPEAVAKTLKSTAASSVYGWEQQRICASDLLDWCDQPERITIGDATIDVVLGGGVVTRGITEVVGQSSSGKTQLLMQLLLTVQLPRSLGGLDGEAVYVYTEGKLPTNRLQQLIASYSQTYPDIIDQEKAWNSIYTMRLQTTDAQHTVLAYQLPAMLQKYPDIRLIVIDSIAALYRGEHYELNDSGRLMIASEVCDLGIRLKKLADQHNVAVVVANQVTDDFTMAPNSNIIVEDLPKKYWKWARIPMYCSQTETYELELGTFAESLSKQATLGLTWANAVNCRIRMAKSSALDQKTRRILCLEFSPFAGRKGCEIEIDDCGIRLKAND